MKHKLRIPSGPLSLLALCFIVAGVWSLTDWHVGLIATGVALLLAEWIVA